MGRKLASAIAIASMLASSAAFAAGNVEQAALAPGGTADIHQAQGMDAELTMGLLAAAVVITGIVLVVTSTGNGTHATPSTTAG